MRNGPNCGLGLISEPYIKKGTVRISAGGRREVRPGGNTDKLQSILAKSWSQDVVGPIPGSEILHYS
jgi:hypothetical protein